MGAEIAENGNGRGRRGIAGKRRQRKEGGRTCQARAKSTHNRPFPPGNIIPAERPQTQDKGAFQMGQDTFGDAFGHAFVLTLADRVMAGFTANDLRQKAPEGVMVFHASCQEFPGEESPEGEIMRAVECHNVVVCAPTADALREVARRAGELLLVVEV